MQSQSKFPYLILFVLLLYSMKIFEINPDSLLESATSENSEFVFVEDTNSGSKINQIMIPVFFTITALLFLSDASARKLMVRKPAPFLFIIATGLVMMAGISISEYTRITISRSGSQILFLSSLAFLAYVLHDQQRLMLTVGLAFLTALAIDLGLYYVLGTGFTEKGGFAGYHRNLNVTGHQYGIATMVFISLAILRKNPLFLIVSLVSAGLLLTTESKTSMGAIGIFVVFSFFYGIPIARTIIMVLTLVGVFAISLYFALGNNDPEIFTGRGDIWNFMAPYIWEQPLLGYGYSSFWDVGAQSFNKTFGGGFIENINTGHNGIIDLVLGVGFLGVGLFFVLFLVASLHLSRLSFRYVFIHYLFIAFLVSNVTESFLFYYQNVMWTTLVLITCSTYVHYRPEKRRRTRSRRGQEYI